MGAMRSHYLRPGAQAAEYGQIYRVYAVSRCVLMLIQFFAIHSLSPSTKQYRTVANCSDDLGVNELCKNASLSRDSS